MRSSTLLPCGSFENQSYGWGIHCDADGRVALYGVESPEYAHFVSSARRGRDGAPLTVKYAMRSKR